MASTVHVQVVIPAVSLITRDEAINTFTFHTGGSDSAATLAAAVAPILADFYNDEHGSGVAIADYLSANRLRTTDGCLMRWYDITTHLNGSAAGPPVYENTWTLGGSPDNLGLPEEVAVCLSFHGDFGVTPEFGPGDARQRSRKRGRVYIGPLNSDVMETDNTGPQRPNDGVQNSLVDAGTYLRDADAGWSVWSRRDAALYPVTGGWVDDAYDTVRGRGPDPSARIAFPPPV